MSQSRGAPQFYRVASAAPLHPGDIRRLRNARSRGLTVIGLPALLTVLGFRIPWQVREFVVAVSPLLYGRQKACTMVAEHLRDCIAHDRSPIAIYGPDDRLVAVVAPSGRFHRARVALTHSLRPFTRR